MRPWERLVVVPGAPLTAFAALTMLQRMPSTTVRAANEVSGASGRVLDRVDGPALLVLPQLQAGDHGAVHFVRAVGEAEDSCRRHQARQLRVGDTFAVG